MASPFKIPKRKQAAGPDSTVVHVQSPLSRLENLKSSRVGADRMHSQNTFGPRTSRQSVPCEPIFTVTVKTLLGLGSPTGRASAAGRTRDQSHPRQRAETASPYFSFGWRPKRASDRLEPTIASASPPQRRKSGLIALSLNTDRLSVASLDSLAELRGERHAGSFSASRGAAEAKRNSPECLNQTIPSLSASDRTSGDDFASPTGTRNKSSAGKAPKGRPSLSAGRISPRASRTERLGSSGNLEEDPREKERRRWAEFSEKRRPNRSCLRLRTQTPAEPIVLSSEEEEQGEDDGGGGKGPFHGSDRVEESCPGSSEAAQGQQACPSRGECKAPPSYLQLEFTSLHAGLMHTDANGEMMITESGITLPVTGAEEGEVTVVASQVRGYGVWDGGVARDGTLLAGCKGPAPSLLFLWVTDAQANLLQAELAPLRSSRAASGPSCCFLLLVLRQQLQELQAALLASILDMEEYRKGSSSSSGLTSPLEWTDGLLLLHNCPPPLDQHLLRLLGCSTEKSRNGKSSQKSSGRQHLPTRLIQYPAPPCKGRISVTEEDLACLEDGAFLNDVIIDFYLKYLFLDGVGGSVAERSHVFSSFFYKQLSRRRAAGESDAPSAPDRHTRHRRVKTWTRHVDVFTKDFLFVPVNQEAHWFLVVVCFPGLEDLRYRRFQSRTGSSEQVSGKPSISRTSQQLPECLQQTCQRDAVLKRPCILVMDSLKLSCHDNVCRLIRDYLQVEWEVRRGTPRLFTPDGTRSSSCRVPLQDNSSDCEPRGAL
ncbi:sentrin-specific protease 7-like isoform X2 [Brachionichthys hirsutus]|uniref:sentrin-specific protease 7-like isoform X2 n=1 Tax=Brachionichthys hirsutus TaxID=412623 RepID=UPI003604AE5E